MHDSYPTPYLKFAFNQHEFAKGCTQKQIEDLMLATLKESISIPGQMICLLHPWQDPVPFRRVWCLFELYTAISLGAKVVMVSGLEMGYSCILSYTHAHSFQHFPPEDAKGFYSKLRTEEAVDETTALVPTIDASEAQATVESDRVRIFEEITDKIGMEKFDAQLQEYLEGAMRATAAEALVERGGVDSVVTGGSKATLGLLRGGLQELAKAQSETKQELVQLVKAQEDTKQEVLAEVKRAQGETKQEVLETKQEVLETKQELAVLATAQEEVSKETTLMGQRMAVLERKMDTMLELLRGIGSNSAASSR
jgi:hypothetical protein